MAKGHYESLRLPVGAKFSRSFTGGRGIIWIPETRVFYVREFCDDTARVWSTAGSILAADGAKGRNSGRFGVGLNAHLTERLNLRVDYDYELYEHTSADALALTLGVRW
ncbi:MAG: autotransporter outer membrane beta-barrel domain-containing protein [Planctomycetaceae bacterium]|nr:autotransporter outer membrane beta-barrel domain-containing protein [Planctomycetaceae bacterium]